MSWKLYNSIHSHIILLILAHACARVTSLLTSSTVVKCNNVENGIQTCVTSQYTHGFDRLQVLTSPWSPSTDIRSATQTMGESPSQRNPKHKRGGEGCGAFETHDPACELVPSTSSQAPIPSVPIPKGATSEQLSSLNILPASTPPVAAAPATSTASNNNAPNPTNLPGNAPSVPPVIPDQNTALDSALNSKHVAPVRSYQMSTIPQKSTTHPPDTSNNIPDATNLAPPPGKPQTASNSRGATSPAPSAASEDWTLVRTSRTPTTPPSPTSERALAIPSTDQSSMPPTMIPKIAPAILTILSSALNAHPAWQGIGNGRRLNSSDTARDSGAISSINNGTSGQKSSTAANTRANMTALSRPSLGMSSTLIVANSTTVRTGSTTGSQITLKSSTSLFSVGAITTSPATVRSSSSASGLQFKETVSRLRGLEMIWLLGYLAGCMMVMARVLV